MGKYKLTWRDIKLEDFKTYLFAMFKAFIPKKKIKTLDELEQFIQTKSAWATQVTLYNYLNIFIILSLSNILIMKKPISNSNHLKAKFVLVGNLW